MHVIGSTMGRLSCNAESAIAICDCHNYDFSRKQINIRRKPNNEPFEIREFTYSDLHSATHGFSAKSFLGKGSHGSVYKAVFDNGKLVAAVKRTAAPQLSENNSRNCINSPAENEIEILSRVRSPRLVNLLGFGVDPDQGKLIVVEFMPNGSLHDLLHARTRPPGWVKRLRLALQIARAVQHLHSSNPPVIHRDIKSSNVLIDSNWNARLGDFGLALRGHSEDVRVKCTPPAGTLGYLDPGYLAPEDLSTKSDVFSFGILLLEIISGRKAIDVDYSPPSVVDWAVPLIKAGDYTAIRDPRLRPPEDAAVMLQLAVLVARCVRSTAEKRLAISDVVDCLRAVNRIASSPIWNSLGRRVGRFVNKSSQSVKYEPLDDPTENFKTRRAGSRRSRKKSSVPGVEPASEAIGSSQKIRVARSKSVGSVHELKFGLLDSNLGGNQLGLARRRPGLAVKMSTVRLSKSRSTGTLQSLKVVQHGRSSNVEETKDSKSLINLEKGRPRRSSHLTEIGF